MPGIHPLRGGTYFTIRRTDRKTRPARTTSTTTTITPSGPNTSLTTTGGYRSERRPARPSGAISESDGGKLFARHAQRCSAPSGVGVLVLATQTAVSEFVRYISQSPEPNGSRSSFQPRQIWNGTPIGSRSERSGHRLG